jgi:hypothetical protein
MKRIVVLAVSAVLASCGHPETRWESVCQIVKRAVVEEDKEGPLLVDLELEWDPCPGDQFQVVRGGHDFAVCTAKYKEGTLVPVHVRHFWDARGYYRWDVEQVGDCKREVEIAAPGSYEKGQECSDVVYQGHKLGFSCSRKPFKKLVSTCPWMARD